MKKFFKWFAIGVGSLALLLVLIGSTLFFRGRSRAAKSPEYAAAPPAATTPDAAVLARGEHIATAIAPCAGCHGAGFAGTKFATPSILVDMHAPNLTRGKGGVGANTPEQWDRAIRGGIGRDGRQLMIMPSAAYAHMSDTDYAALLAYLGTLAPVDNELPPRKLGPLGSVLVGAGAFPLAADLAAASGARPSTVAPGPTAEYGGYLVELGTCRDCHGAQLQGQPGHGSVPAPSLHANARTWTEEGFRTAMRSGKTPEGRVLNPAEMPWPFYAKMTDEELKAIWLYLQSMPVPAAKS